MQQFFFFLFSFALVWWRWWLTKCVWASQPANCSNVTRRKCLSVCLPLCSHLQLLTIKLAPHVRVSHFQRLPSAELAESESESEKVCVCRGCKQTKLFLHFARVKSSTVDCRHWKCSKAAISVIFSNIADKCTQHWQNLQSPWFASPSLPALNCLACCDSVCLLTRKKIMMMCR